MRNEAFGAPPHTIRAILTLLPLLALIGIAFKNPSKDLIEILKMLTIMAFSFYFAKYKQEQIPSAPKP